MYKGMPSGFSGYMHRAAMAQDVEAVSNRACVLRSCLSGCIDRDPMKMFEKVREKGYLVVVDPNITFRIDNSSF